MGCYHTPKTRPLPVSGAAKCPDAPDGCGEVARILPDRTAVLYHEQGCPVEGCRDSARLLDAAEAVARQAPARRGTYVSHAKIYWPCIEELRAALDGLGVEWRNPR